MKDIKKQKWHPVEFAGWWHIMDEPYYEAKDVLDEEHYPKEAERNATLAAAAPDLLRACENAILELQLLPCKVTADVITELESAINKALGK